MKQTNYGTSVVPTANLAVNKSRIKIYNKEGDMPTYYLKSGQEFQIELFNPTTDVILAKIILNGKPISQGGLVLNPGQRVFLERYLDVAKKFLFDTYEVANTNEVKAAIEKNGDFKVEFYRERKQPNYINLSTLNTNNTRTIYGGPNYGSGILRGSSTGGYVGPTTTFTTNSMNSLEINNVTNTSYYSNPIDNNSFFCNSNAVITDGLLDFDSSNITISQKPILSNLKRSKSIETGRVEEGSNSDQKIKTIDKNFEFFAFHTIEYKMLPISQKINTSEDINVKVYCTNCAHKLKKEYKFCPVCATRV